ncbi:pilus assembly protein TadG-related protein [Benzoatithermus flavus]|uniref:Pilus assembly protein TadG-related protein n=1 Tax=Benzoatithermus flavus TaxID=3108223 RepID=A0ABU8XNQ3_9PROT
MMPALLGASCRPIRIFGALKTCRRGATTLMVAIASFSLLLTSLLAIDIARAHLVQTKLQQAADAAALSAGRDFYGATLATDMRQIFDANFPNGYLGATVESFTYSVASSTTISELLTLEVRTKLPSPVASFAKLVGFDAYHLGASATVERRTKGVELVLVLDTTFSMISDPGNKMGGLKTAAKELLNILYGDRETVPNFWVAVVPYIASVNVGTANIGFLASGDRALPPANAFKPEAWGGCVLARAAPRDQNDDPPSVEPFRSYLYPDLPSSPWPNDWGPGRTPQTYRATAYDSYGNGYVVGLRASEPSYGPNTGCPPPILPLSVEKSKAIAAINALLPESRGGTITSEGMAWGWRVLSPRWRGLWAGAPSNLPLDYDTPGMDKVMVVLTDGENQMLVTSYNGSLVSPYTAYETYKNLGITATNATTAQNAAKAEIDKRTQAVCTGIKSKGVIIYTITFGAAPSAVVKALMQGCATDAAHYFHSPDNATLTTVFRSIGSQLTNLRIVR